MNEQASEGLSMSNTVLTNWHKLLQSRDMTGLNSILAENIVFHSPVVHTPQIGKDITCKYLSAAVHVFLNESFRYVKEIKGPRDAALEFEVEIDGISVNGVDMIKWNDEGRIVEFKVLIRPLKAVNLIHKKMAAMLQANQ